VLGLSQSGRSNLDGVTWQGPLDLAGQDLTIENGLTVTNKAGSLPGTVDLGNGGTLDFSGNQSLDNVAIGSPGSITANSTVTLGRGVAISQTTSSSGLVITGAGTIVNQGAIALLGSPTSHISGTEAVILVTKFENAGTLAATGLGTIAPGLDSYFNITSPTFNNDATGLIEALGGSITVSTATNFTNDGTILVDTGTVDIAPLLNGSGTADLRNQGTLELGSAVTAEQVIGFLGSGVLILDQPVFFGGTIEHIGTSDVVRLGLAASGVGYAAGKLEMQTSGGQDFSLAIPGAMRLSDFIINTGRSSTTIELACFAAGTHIATACGEVMVEDMREGDLVRLAGSGALLPAVWIGHRDVDCRRHPQPAQVWPVRIAAHAFGHNIPERQLYLSPDHAVFVDGVLVPVKYLVNGATIAQVKVDTITYYHVELPRHAILLAEGLAAESFLGMRDAFANGGLPVTLLPDFSSRLREAKACAPLVVTGSRVDALRARLARRGASHPQYTSPTEWERSARSAG
jgi:collagen type I/II/III/V/XI/XXIV/XXVII alpha